MDDKSLQKFAYYITYQLHQSKELQQYNGEDMYQSLKLLRDNPDSVKQYKDKEPELTSYLSCLCPSVWRQEPLRCLEWFLFMLPIMILILPFVLLEIILEFLTYEPYTCE